MNASNQVVVAMSGGVDSSVAALLLHQQGVSSLGVSMQVWDYRKNGGCSSRATCCSPDDFTDARRVAAKIGIPYYVFDFEQSFRANVIDNFIATYKRGETPNPCIDCNNKVKFAELRHRAHALGCTHVATGHYARVVSDEHGFHLLRGVDENKDQSYFLYNLTQAELAETLFPVGAMTKPEVREHARAAGLVTADKAESQDICFVSGSLQDFLVRIGGKPPRGDILTSKGEKIGEHDGIHAFTVGQRKGLRIGGHEEPLYVLELDSSRNAVIVGQREELERSSFLIERVSWTSPRHQASLPLTCLAQLRHRHRPVRVVLHSTPDGLLQAEFTGEWSTVSPGQAAVFYDLSNTEVLGGGRVAGRRGGALDAA